MGSAGTATTDGVSVVARHSVGGSNVNAGTSFTATGAVTILRGGAVAGGLGGGGCSGSTGGRPNRDNGHNVNIILPAIILFGICEQQRG